MAKKKLILIDGNAIIHRAYHALPPLTTKKGELVNAVYGFVSVLLNVVNKFETEYIITTFDLKEPTFRHKEFKDYKATRIKAPDDLYEQIPRIKELVRAFNIPIFEKEGYEADDLIATFARQVEKLHPEIEIIVVTGDLDTLQLVNEQTKVFALRRGMSESVLYDEKAIMERYGLTPEQMVDYKGLRGDPSDNLPGVKGVGEKTAIELLKKYGSVENVYKNLSEIKEGIRKKLEKDKLQAFFSKKLARLVYDVPVKFELEKSAWHDFDRVKVINLLRELEFFSLLRRLPGYEEFSKKQEQEREAGEKKDFHFGQRIIWKNVPEKEIIGAIREILKGRQISLAADIENENKIRGLAVAAGPGEAFYFSFSGKSFPKEIKNILEDEGIEKIGFDLKKDWKYWKKLGVELKNISFDVMIAAYLLNPGTRIEWEALVLENLGIMIEKEGKKSGQSALIFKDAEKENEKICQRAAYNFALSKILEVRLKEINQDQLKEGGKSTIVNIFRNLELPLVEILGNMEIAGIKINKLVLNGISEKLEKRIGALEKDILKLSGRDFNVNSSVQLREVLFERLKISTRDIKKGKTGFSTASPELQKIKSEHPIIEKIEEYRELFKLKTTYLDTLPNQTDKKSRLHTTFNQAVTATGRLSSSDPNLQNIPIRTDLGQLIRTSFEVEEGFRLVGADYSQIELRIVAHLSGDVKMITTFLGNEDIHTATASRINKVDLDKVTKKMRSSAKALNFGIIYGMSTFGFSQSAGVDQSEAKEFIRKYFENYPQVSGFLEEVKINAREKGYVETELGRRRNIAEINSSNFQVRAAAERMAVNMPIQGLAADIIKLAMIEADELIQKKYPSSKMILQIHDELLFEVPERDAKKFAKDIKEVMENIYKLSVPLIVDVKVGDNWGEV